MKFTLWINLVGGILVSCAIGCDRNRIEADSPRVLSHTIEPLFISRDRTNDWRVSHTFDFSNSQSAPVTLSVKHLTCGCATCTIDNTTLAPGDTTHITLAIELRYERSRRSEAAVISIGSSEKRDLTVYLAVDVYPRIHLMPAPLSEVVLDPGARIKRPVQAISYQPSAEQENAISLTVAGPGVTVSCDAPIVEETNHVRKALVRGELVFDSTVPGWSAPGDDEAAHEIRATSGEYMFKLPVRARLRPQIIAEPRSVFLQPITTEPAVTTVRLTSQDAFSILRSEVGVGAISVDAIENDARREHLVRITRTSTDIERDEIGDVRIITDHPHQTSVRIPVYALR